MKHPPHAHPRPHGNGHGHGNGHEAGFIGRGPALITGGAGFIGANLADRLLSDGAEVLLLDNLARPGVERNVRWLEDRHGERVRLHQADVRDAAAVHEAAREAGLVFHLAAQVAVTTSLDDPMEDFEVNARGTLTLLEALRRRSAPPPLLFTSTNKVYGDLADVRLRAGRDRYEPVDPGVRSRGVGERPLAFRSPYGCSKGAADQYVLDYARTFDLPAVVFRMSCIYGPHQLGTEDQGWVAHFLMRAIRGEPITLFGDGRQVRDVLFIEDLVDAMLRAVGNIGEIGGRAFNMGGGVDHAISLIELLDLIERLHGERPRLETRPWRPGDQRYYVSDTTRFTGATGWSPRVGVEEGVERLYQWLAAGRRRPTTVKAEAAG